MTVNKKLSNAFSLMLPMPAFVVHISVRGELVSKYRLARLAGLPSITDDERHEVAASIAELFAANGIHVTKVAAEPSTGLIEIQLNPMAFKSIATSAIKPDVAAMTLLNMLISGIESEIGLSNLKEKSELGWANYFGLSEEARQRVFVSVAHGTALSIIPDLYVLHQIPDPQLLATSGYGKEFANAVEQVVYVDPAYSLNQTERQYMPEETIALPMDQFKELAKKYGFSEFTLKNKYMLVAEKSA